MSLFKKPTSDQWHCVFVHHGRRYKKSTGTSDKRKAAEVERAWRVEIEKSNTPAPLVPSITVLRDLDIARAREEGRTQRYIDRDIVGYFAHLHKYFQDVSKVTDASLLAYVKHRRDQGIRRQSISREIAILKRGLRLAHIEGPKFWPKLGRDPADPKLASKEHSVTVWCGWLSRLEGEALHLALFAMLTGLRRGELYRVLPEDIIDGVVTVKEKVRRPHPRRVVLSETAAKVAALAVPFRHEHKKAFLTAGRPRSINLRDCRAYFATHAGDAGDGRAVDLALGHTGVPMRYAKFDFDRLRKVAEAVETHLRDVVKYDLSRL